MISKLLTLAGAFFAGWLTLHGAFHQIPGDNWVLLGLSLVCFMASFVIS